MNTCGPPHCFGPTIASHPALHSIIQPSPGSNQSSQLPFPPRSTSAWYPPLGSTLPNYPPSFDPIPSSAQAFQLENVSPTGTENSFESTTTPSEFIEYHTTTTGYDGGGAGQVMTTPTPILIDPEGYGYGSVLFHDHRHHRHHHHHHDHDQVQFEPDMSPPFGITPDPGDGRDIVSVRNGPPPLMMIGIGLGGEDVSDDQNGHEKPLFIPNTIVVGLGNQLQLREDIDGPPSTVMKSELTNPPSSLDSEPRRPTVFPNRSARAGVHPPRNGSRPFPSGGGTGARAKKPAKARTTVLSCTECRRLKLKCNRIFPCETCINRGYAYLCPDRTNPNTRRAVGSTLAELEALREMVVRLRQESGDREREWKVEREGLSRELEELRRRRNMSLSSQGSLEGQSHVSSFEGQGSIVIRTQQPQAENIPLASPVDIAEEPPPVPPPPPPPPPSPPASLLEHVA